MTGNPYTRVPHTQSPPSSPVGALAQVLEVNDDREEAKLVASRIRVRRRAGTPLSEIAILFRTARQGRTIERALVRSAGWQNLYTLYVHKL